MTLSDRKIRDGLMRGLSVSALSSQESFLTFSGILPVNFPDGTRLVILPDAHIPAHMRRLFWAVLRFLNAYKPHVLISIGDWADIFAWSRHNKPLRVIQNGQTEIDEASRLWAEAMEISEALWGFLIMGNHEDRIYRFLQEFAPMLGGLVNPHNRETMNFHSMMGLTAKDNTTVLYGVEERGGFEGGMSINGDFNLHHGIFVRPNPTASPLADMDRWQWSVGHGHTHRFGMVARETSKGVLRGYEFGHLVDMDHSYLAYAHKMFPNWAPGFAVGMVHNGVVHVQPVPIQPIEVKPGQHRLSFLWDGKVYSESDR